MAGDTPRAVTIRDLARMREEGSRIVMVTAYTYPEALLADAAGIDMVLVGDSVGNVVLGYPGTIPVTVDEMVHHTRAVARGIQRAMLVADLPFGSYHEGIPQAVASSVRLIKEGGAQAVKLEGGREVAEVVEALVKAGIPVVAHIGLTPQRVVQLSGYRVQGREADAARALVADARALEAAGAFLLVLECVPAEVGRLVTGAITIPTIGIGAGPFTTGQVLVLYDLLGLSPGPPPRFVKAYEDLKGRILAALKQYAEEVRQGAFPGSEHVYRMPEAEARRLQLDQDDLIWGPDPENGRSDRPPREPPASRGSGARES